MKRIAWSLVLAGTVVGSGLRTQAPKRLPAKIAALVEKYSRAAT
jgi:hypothetical protein